MKNRRHTPEQVIRKLAEGDKLLNRGQSVEEVSRHLEITDATWYRWKNQYGGMKADDVGSHETGHSLLATSTSRATSSSTRRCPP